MACASTLFTPCVWHPSTYYSKCLTTLSYHILSLSPTRCATLTNLARLAIGRYMFHNAQTFVRMAEHDCDVGHLEHFLETVLAGATTTAVTSAPVIPLYSSTHAASTIALLHSQTLAPHPSTLLSHSLMHLGFPALAQPHVADSLQGAGCLDATYKQGSPLTFEVIRHCLCSYVPVASESEADIADNYDQVVRLLNRYIDSTHVDSASTLNLPVTHDGVGMLGIRHVFLTVYNWGTKRGLAVTQLMNELHRLVIRNLDYAVASPDGSAADQPERTQVCVVSNHLHTHSVGRLLVNVIPKLNAAEFTLTVFTTSNVNDDITERYRRRATEWVNLSGVSFEAAQEVVGEAGCDVVVFTDFGMDGWASFMAYGRYAEVQVRDWRKRAPHSASANILVSDWLQQIMLKAIFVSQTCSLANLEGTTGRGPTCSTCASSFGLHRIAHTHVRSLTAQVMFWGHPVSTMLDSVDYFIKGKGFGAEEEGWSEQVRRERRAPCPPQTLSLPTYPVTLPSHRRPLCRLWSSIR